MSPNRPVSGPPHRPEPGPAGASRVGAWEQRIERIAARIRPWSWLWPPMAFLAGVGSFFLVERQQWLGAMLTLGMLLTWFLLLSESLIGRFLAQRGYPTLPRGVTTFIAQMVHQETLFFTLPFLLATTVWTSGQALFTLSMVALAILSILDPLYYRLAERRRGLYFAFHAQCVFLVVLVTLPTLLHLTTGQSLLLALAATVIFSLPSLLHLLRPMTARRWLLMLALLPVLAGGAWVGRIWVPPASLWISGSALSPEFNVETRSPQGQLRLTPDALGDHGLYAYTAIHAPRGLREEIVHEWRHGGELIDRIPLEIQGGREQGYRAWTHKRNFPEHSAGRWRIDVMTASGQRIGVLRFRVAADTAAATLADGHINVPIGLPGLDVRRLVARSEDTTSANGQNTVDDATPSPEDSE
ncbi:DUF5924 family protein [Halomonas elongata]|uniref:DUF2914 domain protein n=1 Tax=Halomonas elongata (strain ATCC 33173 / DSM 2581 / NBRC 15536 / NCIMB 2198 / 1H9) TaxID=768066 RepID=E1V878_HALED|nr:DUF5924 family protein [Halomonas elongata]WBF18878.1 DUF2914 domain-containing protein [Halomonas elongata]WPU47737.1 DUF5924 family protein [Halomonas elongata DSM 2581]CBV41641.1 DUF2914 domain protein [Halomonas elongata DSM 2581]